MGNHELLPKSIEHSGPVVAMPEVSGRHVQQGPDMPPKALWGAVVEVIGDVRHRKTGIFEQSRGPNKAGHGKISFGRWHPCTKESTHHGAGQNTQFTSQQADVPNARLTGEDRFEEAPAVARRASEIHFELSQQAALSAVTAVGEKGAPKLAPSGGMPDIYQTTNAALAQRKDGMRRLEIELAQQGHRRNPGKLADK